MTPEQVSAMERVRAAAERRRNQDYLRHADPMLRYKDANLLADEYLSFIAERDDRAIDEAWLRSIGFVTAPNPDYVTTVAEPGCVEIGVRVKGGLFVCICYEDRDDIRVNSITTRGQLLRLLSSLGITVSPAGGA